MSVYDTTSTPIRPRRTGACRPFVIQPWIPVRRSETYSLPHHETCFHPKPALHGTSSATARRYCGAEPVFFAINSPLSFLVLIGLYRLSSPSILMYFLTFSIRKVLSFRNRFTFFRRLTIRSSRTLCNTTSTWSGKLRRARFSAQAISAFEG